MRKVLIIFAFVLLNFSIIHGQYEESFDIPNRGILLGTCGTNDPTSCASFDFSGVNWTLGGDLSGIDSEGFFTVNGNLQGSDIDEEVCWISPVINIAGVLFSSVEVDFAIPSGSTWESSTTPGSIDFLDVNISVDGTNFSRLANKSGCPGSGHTISVSGCSGGLIGPQFFSIDTSGIIGDELYIQVCIDVNSSTDIGLIENVKVPESGTTVCDGTTGLTFYVDNNANGNGDGLSWTNAYTSLQDALAEANSCGSADSIKIACGTYYPDVGNSVNLGDRDASFNVDFPFVIIGGYDPSTNQINAYGQTILSGDLSNKRFKTDNTYRIFEISAQATLNNLVIENAYNDNSNEIVGAGIYATNGIFKNIILRYNENVSASSVGGGFFATQNAVTLENVLIHNNKATNYGGGIALNDINSGSSTLKNVTIADNSSNLENGGLDHFNATTDLYNTIIYDNLPFEIALFGSTLNASYTVIESANTWPGTGNTNSDPRFINKEQDNYRIAECGSAFNQGNTADAPNSGIDLDRNDRNKLFSVDIGAYEVQRADLRSQINPLEQGMSLAYSCPKQVKIGIVNSTADVVYKLFSPSQDGSVVGNGEEVILTSLDYAKDYNYYLLASRDGYSKLDFAENKRVSIPYDPELALVSDEDFTMEFKVNLDNITGTKRIYSQEGAFSIGIYDDKVYLSEFGNYNLVINGYNLLPGIEYEIKVKFEKLVNGNSLFYVWVNDVIADSWFFPSMGFSNTNEISIGGRPTGEWMDGTIDYLQIKKGNRIVLRYDFVTGHNSTTVYDLRALEDGDSPRNGTMIGFDPLTDWVSGDDEHSILCNPVAFVNVEPSTTPVNHFVSKNFGEEFESLRFQIEQASCPNDTIRFNSIDTFFLDNAIYFPHDLNIIGDGISETILSGSNKSNAMFIIPADYKILMKDFQVIDKPGLAFFVSNDHTLDNILFKEVNTNGIGPMGIDYLSNLKIEGDVFISNE